MARFVGLIIEKPAPKPKVEKPAEKPAEVVEKKNTPPKKRGTSQKTK